MRLALAIVLAFCLAPAQSQTYPNRAEIREDIAKWAEVVRVSGAKAE